MRYDVMSILGFILPLWEKKINLSDCLERLILILFEFQR